MSVANQIGFALFVLFLLPLYLYALWFAVSCFFRDCFGALWPRQAPAGPKDWRLLEMNELPRPDKDKLDREKEHFSRSLTIHGECIPRTSHYGLIGRPLRRDE